MVNSESPKFKCPYCNKKYRTIIHLKSHIDKVHLLYDYSCPYCNENFGSFLKLQDHLKFKSDKFHKNLFHLLTRRHIRFVDKKLFLDN